MGAGDGAAAAAVVAAAVDSVVVTVAAVVVAGPAGAAAPAPADACGEERPSCEFATVVVFKEADGTQ